MAKYRAQGPDGRMYNFEGPAGLTKNDATFFLGQYFALGADQPDEELALKPPEPKAETGFIPSIKRGFAQTGMLLGDVLPAMAARAVGADEYAERQLKEAAETQADIAKKYPAAVPSFTDIKGAGDLVSYITEAVGEAIPSILPGIFTGGVASIAGRGAVVAAKQAAEKAAMGSIAKGVTAEEAEKIAMKAGIDAATKTALKYQATGAVAGSAAQNLPDVYQNILEETGKESLGAALVAGGFNALLDSILPIQLLRKVKLSGIPEQEIIGAWYKRGAAGLGKGFLTEGGTEAVQEMSSAAAEKFVDDNQEFFSGKNLIRFIDAGLKGGLGGGVITGASDIAFGRAPTQAVTPGVVPTDEETEALLKQAMEKEGMVPPQAPTPAAPAAIIPPQTPAEAPQITPEALAAIGAQETGAPNVERTISEPSRASVPIPEPTSITPPTTPGVGETKPVGVATTGPDVTEPVSGEGVQPSAIKPSLSKLTSEQIAEAWTQPSTVEPTPVPEKKKTRGQKTPSGKGVQPGAVDILDYLDKRDELVRQMDEAYEESSALTDKITDLDSVRAASVLGDDGKPLVLDENGEYDSNKKYEATETLRAKLAESSAKFDAIIKQIDELDAAWQASKEKKKKAKTPVKGPTTEEIETRDLTPEEEAVIEEDPLLDYAISNVQAGVNVQDFADTQGITLTRAETLYDEAKNIIEQEGAAYTEQDQEIDAKEQEALAKEPKKRRKKGPITAQGRESRTGRPDVMGGKPAPVYVNRELQQGNSRPLLQMVRTAAPNPVHRAIAQLLFQNKMFPDIQAVSSLPNGRIAQYHPKTRKIEVTKDALEDTGTLLHEYVHDATLKVIYEYLTGGKLTKEQLQGAKHMDFLMKESGGRVINPTSGATVKDVFPKAYENLYEFVSYGLTDEDFMNVLSRMQIPPDQSYIKTASMWERFVFNVAKLIGFTNEEIHALGLKLGIAPEDVTKSQLAQEYGGDELILRRAGLTPNTMSSEVFAAFMDIIAPPPAAGIDLPSMAATKTIQAPPVSLSQDEAAIINEALEKAEVPERNAKKVVQFLMSKKGAVWLTERFQNDRYLLKRWEDRLKLLGLVDRIDNINNVYGQITTSSGIGVDTYHVHLKGLVEDTQKAVGAYAEKMGIDTRTALSHLHLIMQARHEPERRRVKFVLQVPLVDDVKSIKTQEVFSDPGLQALFSDTDYSPSAFREAVLVALSSKMNNLPEATRKTYAQELRKTLDKVVDDKANHPAITTVTKNGKTTQHKTAPEDFDQNSSKYSVIAGRSPAEIELIKRVFDRPEVKTEIDAVAERLRKVSDKSIELNKEANYFSTPTQNIVDFYGYENYVPFKGRPGKEKENDEFDIFSSRIGGEFQEGQDTFSGRESEADNSIAQVLADGASSALRVGRKNVTLAIKNASNQKLLPGKVIATIPFEDRYLGRTNKQELAGPDKIFHYNADGTVDIIQITNKNISEAIRRQYRESSPIIDAVNRFTSGIGMMHTRYNPAFAPMNFVRDALTNAFTLGAEFGPTEAGRLITQISSDVISGGLAKSLKYAVLYSQGKHDQIKALAEKDPYYKDLQDYVKKGGKVAYLEGVANKGALDKIVEEVGYKQVGANKIATLLRKKDIDNFLDIYNDMFELASRVATFRTMRDTLTSKNVDKGMAPDKAAKDATEQAVEYAKNLANFEQVGRWGKEAGALFMFFRPAATGAVRAIEALAPAFMKFDEAEFRLDAKESGASDAQIEHAVKTMKGRRASARKMAAGLAGMGMMIYWAAVMMAGDDEEGRNKVLMDDPARWTRYARFHIPGTDIFFQIPWGFGLGFFASFGAQLASMLSGRNSLGDVIGNSFPTFLDSFMPLPVSRISPVDNPMAWAVDTALPSAVRPFVEYMMNLDGLGREIYNNRQTRYGDAYTGGDNIPETYKAAARSLFNMTDGKIDISPNTLFFFASNYIDGLAKTATGIANAGMSISGYKEPDLRNDIPILASFFGTKSNVDAREFSKVEKQIQGMEKRINSLKDKPEMLSRYLDEHAEDYALVQFYNQAVNGTLRQLRQTANQIRANPELTPKERKQQVDEIIKLQNAVKRDLINGFEAVGGIKP